MKKSIIFAVIAALVLSMSLSACSNSQVEDSEESSISSESSVSSVESESSVDSESSSKSNDSDETYDKLNDDSLVGTTWVYKEIKQIGSTKDLDDDDDDDDSDADDQQDISAEKSKYENLLKDMKINFIDTSKCNISISGVDQEDKYEINDSKIEFDDLDMVGTIKNGELELDFDYFVLAFQKQ